MAKKDQVPQTPAEGSPTATSTSVGEQAGPTPEDPAILREFAELAVALGVQLADPEEIEAEREGLLERISGWTTERNQLDARIADAQAQVRTLSGAYGRVADLCKVVARFGKVIPARYAGSRSTAQAQAQPQPGSRLRVSAAPTRGWPTARCRGAWWSLALDAKGRG